MMMNPHRANQGYDSAEAAESWRKGIENKNSFPAPVEGRFRPKLFTREVFFI